MNIFNKVAKITLACLLIVTTAVILNPYVPNNMDEFSLYHTLACNYYPNNKLNNFRTGCNVYDLKLPFTETFLPIREFGYMGSILSLYLTPFFILLRDPIITRIVGLLFLIAQSLILGKLLHRKWLPIFIGLFMFFPYFFQHFVDTGAVAIQITLLLGTLFALETWFSHQQLKYLLLAVIICFVGVFAKLTFIWYIPSLVLYFLTQVKNYKKNSYQQLIIAFVIFSTLLVILFSSIDKHGRPYFQEFFINNPKTQFFHSDIFNALLNPYETTQLIFTPNSRSFITTLYSILMLGVSPIIWIWGYLHKKKFFRKSFVWYTMFLLTVLIISSVGKAWSIHHIILAYPYLVLSFFSIFSHSNKIIPKSFLLFFYMSFILYNSYFFLTFKNDRIKVGNEPIRKPINTMLSNPKLAQEYIYVVTDWGMYYYQSLFGNKEQSVVYIEPFLDLRQVHRLNSIRNNNHKRLLFIYNQAEHETNPEFIRNNFEVKPCYKFEQSDSWKILIEPGISSSLCN